MGACTSCLSSHGTEDGSEHAKEPLTALAKTNRHPIRLLPQCIALRLLGLRSRLAPHRQLPNYLSAVVSRLPKSVEGLGAFKLARPASFWVAVHHDLEAIRGSYADNLVLGNCVHQIVQWQMHRSRVACTALKAAADSVHVRDLQRQLGKCVAVAHSLEEALHRLLQIKALATIVDAVDALCMHAAAVVAISESVHLLHVPRMLLFLSHLQTCMRAVLMRIEDPVAEPLVRYRTPRIRISSPHAASAANPVHLWYVSIVWLRCRLAQSLSAAPPSGFRSLDTEATATDDSAHNMSTNGDTDADAALSVLHAHSAAMMSRERRRRQSRTADSGSNGFATSTGGLSTISGTTMDFAHADDPPQVCPPAAAEAELLLFASGSHLSPAAALTHPLLWHCLGNVFLNAEYAPFDAVFSALLSGLSQLPCGDDGVLPRPTRAVRDPAGAIELLSAVKKELASELVGFSEVCVGVYTPPHKYAAAADSAMQPLIAELLGAQQRIVGTSAVVYVGALARAFPAPMYFEDCLSVLADLGRSRPSLRRDAILVDETLGGDSSGLPDWLHAPPASGEGRSRLLRGVASVRTFEQLGSSNGQQPGTPKTPFYSPHASLMSEPEAWMTAMSAPTNDGAARTHALAYLLTLHGGWHAAGPVAWQDGWDIGAVDAISQEPSREWNTPPLEALGRADDIACIVSEVEGGAGLIVVSGVHGIGKTLTLHHATLQLLQARTWLDTAYLRLSDDGDDPNLLLARLLHISIAASVPPDQVPQRLAHSLSGGHRCGLVIDNLRSPVALERLVSWARALRQHAPAIQVLFGLRADSSTPVPDGVRHVALLPLRNAVSDSLLERSVLMHAQRRLSIPGVHEDSGSSRRALAVEEHDTQSLKGLAAEGGSSLLSAMGVPDLGTITQPALALAREGLRLCQGVPLLLHTLLQVAVVCVITPQSHDALSTFNANLQVLQRSMTGPLRLTSLVVKQVYACLIAQLSQPAMARFLVNGVQILRVLETCPVPLSPSQPLPTIVPLARQAVDDETTALISAPPSIITSPVGHFAAAAVLLQSGHMHTAHALMWQHSAAMVAQVAALQQCSNPHAVEEALSWLHAVLTIQGARLLSPEQLEQLIDTLKLQLLRSGQMLTALMWQHSAAMGAQGIGKHTASTEVLGKSCVAWLLIEDGKPEAAFSASPSAVQRATLPASTKFTVAHVRAVALARFSMLHRYVGDAAPALHQALDRLNRAIVEANTDLPAAARASEASAGPLQRSALRACASANPFAQAPITGLIRALILKELATVHQHIGNIHATAHLRLVLLSLCNAGSDEAERHLAGYGEARKDAHPPGSDAGAPPFAEAELVSVMATEPSPALKLLLSLDVATGVSPQRAVPARADPPRVLSCLALPPRPLMQALAVRLCEAEAAGAPDCARQAVWLLHGLCELTPQLRSAGMEATIAAMNAGKRQSNHVLQTAHRDALRRALLSGGGGGSMVVRMLLSLARAAHLEWPASGLGRDAALTAAMLLSCGHLRPMPGSCAAWDIIQEACSGGIDAEAAAVMQGFGEQAENAQHLVASPRLSALNSCRSLEISAQHAAPSAAAQAAAAADSPRHVYHERRSLTGESSLTLPQLRPPSGDPAALPPSPPGSLPTPSQTPSSPVLIGEASLAHTYLERPAPVPAADKPPSSGPRQRSCESVSVGDPQVHCSSESVSVGHRQPSSGSMSVAGWRNRSSESMRLSQHRPWSAESLSVAHRPWSGGSSLGITHIGSLETSEDANRAVRLDSVASSGLQTNPSLQVPTGSTVSTPVAFGTGTLASNSTVDASDAPDAGGRDTLFESQPSATPLPTFRPAGLPTMSGSPPAEAPPAPAEQTDSELTAEPSFAGTEASAMLIARSPAMSLASPLQEEPSGAPLAARSQPLAAMPLQEDPLSALLVACSPPASTVALTEEASQASAAALASSSPSSAENRAAAAPTVITAADLQWLQPSSSTLPAASGSGFVSEVSCNVLGIPAVPGQGAPSPGRTTDAVSLGGITLSAAAPPVPLAPDDTLCGSLRAPLVSTTVDGLRSGGAPSSDVQQSMAMRSQAALSQLSRYLQGGGVVPADSPAASTSSLILDSSGNPTVCLRNQPCLPSTAFLSTDVKSSGLLSPPLSQGDAQRRDGNVLAAYMRAPPPQPVVQIGSRTREAAPLLIAAPPPAPAFLPPPVTSGSSARGALDMSGSDQTRQHSSGSAGRGNYPSMTPRCLKPPGAGLLHNATVTTGALAARLTAPPAAAAGPIVTTGADTIADNLLATYDLSSPLDCSKLATAMAAAARPVQTVTTGAVAPSTGTSRSAPATLSPQVVLERPTVTTGSPPQLRTLHRASTVSGPNSSQSFAPTNTAWSSMTSNSMPDRPQSPAPVDPLPTPPGCVVTTGALPSSSMMLALGSQSCPQTRSSSPHAAVPPLPLHTITIGGLTSRSLSGDFGGYHSTAMSNSSATSSPLNAVITGDPRPQQTRSLGSAIPSPVYRHPAPRWSAPPAVTSLSALLSPRFSQTVGGQPTAAPRLSSSDLFAVPRTMAHRRSYPSSECQSPLSASLAAANAGRPADPVGPPSPMRSSPRDGGSSYLLDGGNRVSMHFSTSVACELSGPSSRSASTLAGHSSTTALGTQANKQRCLSHLGHAQAPRNPALSSPMPVATGSSQIPTPPRPGSPTAPPEAAAPGSPILSSLHSSLRSLPLPLPAAADPKAVHFCDYPAAKQWPEEPNFAVATPPQPTATRSLIAAADNSVDSLSGPSEEIGDSNGSMDETVSIQMQMVESGDCAGCSSITVAKMAAVKPAENVRVALVAQQPPTEPLIPRRVGFSGQECTLDFALGGGAAAAAAKNTHIEAANVSFRRWEAKKALQEDAAPAPLAAAAEPSVAESAVTQEVTIEGPAEQGAKLAGVPLPEPSTSSFMSGFDLEGASGLSIGSLVGPHEERVPVPLDPQQSSIMSSLTESVTWVDNRIASVWHENPLGEGPRSEGPLAPDEVSGPSPGGLGLKSGLPLASPVATKSAAKPLPRLALTSPASPGQSRLPRGPAARD